MKHLATSGLNNVNFLLLLLLKMAIWLFGQLFYFFCYLQNSRFVIPSYLRDFDVKLLDGSYLHRLVQARVYDPSPGCT